MSKTTNETLLAAIQETNADLRNLTTAITALVNRMPGMTPEPVTEPKAEPAKAAKPAKASKKAAKLTLVSDKPVRHLVRKNRADFVKAHPWAQGMSTSRIAEAVLTGEHTCVEGWTIGERRIEMVLGKREAKATKPVVAKASPSEPAKPSTGALAERRADGTITPKAEWEIRKALRESGLDPREVDMAMEFARA